MPRFVALLAVIALAVPVFAGPTADALRLVPANTTVCFVVQDLRGTAARVGDSPFAAFFADSKFGKGLLASDAMTQLKAAEKTLSEALGVTFTDLRDDILGDVVVYAYQPPPEGKEAEESGVVIGKAAKPAALAKLVAKLNEVQTKSGELKGTADKTHAGVGYVERGKGDGRKEYYLLRDDGVFAYSVQEAALQQVIDRQAAKDKGVFAGALDKLGAADAVAVLLFEPKALAADLAAGEKAATDPNQKAFLKQFGKVWAAVEAVGVSLKLDTHATLALNLVVAPDKVPEELRPLFRPDDKGTSLWSAIPDDALLAIAGRFEWDKFAAAVQSFLSDEAVGGLKKVVDEVISPVVGKDTFPAVKSGVGPDWGLWLTAPAKGDAGVLPAATFALRVRPAGGKDDTVGQALVGGLDFAVQVFRVEYNKTHADQFKLDEDKSADGTIKYLKNDTALPAGVRPAYGLRGDFFVLATSVDAVKRFAPPKGDDAVKDAPLVRLNAGKLAVYLATRGSELSEVLAGWTGEKADATKADLADYATFLELFDTLELHHTGDGKRMTLSVRAKTARPLKK